jgi:hypothetical protein
MVWALTETGGRRPAPREIEAVVRDLTRAKALQVLTECACAGLFWGLLVSSAAVLAIRLGQLPFPIGVVVAWLLGLALTAAAIEAFRRRPDDLQVAILADIQLNLKQKLSTAWEFARAGTDAALVERLAVQAVKARLPSRANRVFPLRLNKWARLTPLAASLLVLVSVVDLQRITEPAARVVDEVVAGEGARLREYARRMEDHAMGEGLPRSATQARSMQRLGTSMETGTLARRQVLNRLQRLGVDLDEARQAALREGTQTEIAPLDLQPQAALPMPPGSRLRAMLEAVLDGRWEAGDARASRDDREALALVGMSAEDLERALEDFAAGDERELRRALDALSRLGRAYREADELGKALGEVRRARENLGDSSATAEQQAERTERAARAEDGALGSSANNRLGGESAGEDDSFGSNSQPGYNPEGSSRGRPSSLERRGQPPPVALRPEGQIQPGEVFTYDARVLPRPGRPAIESVELDARFAPQLEEVLSKDEYPLHYKEFIRRYFLTLSEGAPVGSGSQSGQRP